jgi:hypothetical protein
MIKYLSRTVGASVRFSVKHWTGVLNERCVYGRSKIKDKAVETTILMVISVILFMLLLCYDPHQSSTVYRIANRNWTMQIAANRKRSFVLKI